MQEVGLAIREGALAYLGQQIKTMIWFVLALAIGLYFLYHNPWVSLAFIGGVAASYIAGLRGHGHGGQRQHANRQCGAYQL